MLVVGECSTRAGFENLEEEWRRLQNDATGHIFQSYDWISAAIAHLPHGRMRTLTARLDGLLVGIAPLCEEGLLRPRIEFLGRGIGDYGDFVCAPGLEEECVDALGLQLFRGRRALGLASLRDVRRGSALEAWLLNSNLRLRLLPGPVCPHIDLPESWNDYLASLGRNAQSNLPRFARKLDRDFDFQIESAGQPEVAESLRTLFELHTKKWTSLGKRGSLGTDFVRSFHLDVAARFSASGHLRLYTLTLDGVGRAVLYCFRDGRTTYFYQSGSDTAFAKYRLGHVLIGHAIRKAIEEGCSEFDMLRGGEAYKSSFWRASADRSNVTALASHLDVDRLRRTVSVRRPLPAPIKRRASAI